MSQLFDTSEKCPSILSSISQIFDSSRLGKWSLEIHDKSFDSGSPIQVLSLPNVAALVDCSTDLAITSDRNKMRKKS